MGDEKKWVKVSTEWIEEILEDAIEEAENNDQLPKRTKEHIIEQAIHEAKNK